MSLNNTPSSERIHIGFFGQRNAGKSSVVNAVTGQKLSVVSDIKGTTTDPVKKAMELLPIGPVIILDTAGTDDTGELGKLRIEKTMQALSKTDIAVLVCDVTTGLTKDDKNLIEKFKEKNIKYLIAYNKCDLPFEKFNLENNEILISALKNININKLKEKLAEFGKERISDKRIVGDLLEKDDIAVLVTPIDSAAPKGRLILPQQMTIRDILDSCAVSVTIKETELKNTLKILKKKPKIVITDSQVFSYVSKLVPDDIPLTSFSILFSRYKGNLETAVKGAYILNDLKDNDTVLISEGCTHHRQCDDIGTVKLPKWICKFTNKKINFEFTSGTEFPDEKKLKKYSLIVHCGGCMLNEREMKSRINCAKSAGVPITNYGILIAHINGILKRATEIFNI